MLLLGKYIFCKNSSIKYAGAFLLLICDHQGASTLDNIEEWKWKLTMLVRNKDEQEVVSTERKDRRDFDHLSILATRMGLYRYHKLL